MRDGDVEPVNAIPLGIGRNPDAVLPIKVAIVKFGGVAVGDAVGGPKVWYCTCQLLGKPRTKVQTALIKDLTCNEEFKLADYTAGDALEFHVHDAEPGGQGKLLGRATLSREQVKTGFAGHLPLLDAANVVFLSVKVASCNDEYPEMPPEPEVEEYNQFKVVLKKSADFEPLGIDIVPQGEKALRVKRIKDGLVREWNRDADKNMEIVPGQFIVGVNGMRGSADDLLKTIAKETSLELTILRPGSTSRQ